MRSLVHPLHIAAPFYAPKPEATVAMPSYKKAVAGDAIGRLYKVL